MSATEHPRILRSEEPYLPSDTLHRELDTLQRSMDANDIDAVHAMLSRVVEGYRVAAIVGEAVVPIQGEALVWASGSRTLH